eukprot:gnl/Ergobibamus_cyprinoides/187.p1 GENE.gnl/Ergobibamus_cyprinoides/187~~gnl/Ergobibamus_cyprinoides/187.p1  ORF type:complete len:333 (+),score=32.23 gnl/Ergobibamus_cyprinoides/187:406-1404(+)
MTKSGSTTVVSRASGSPRSPRRSSRRTPASSPPTTETTSLVIDPASAHVKSHLDHFLFTGIFIGLALRTGTQVDLPFARPVWTVLAGGVCDLSLADLAATDAALAASLQWLLDTDLSSPDGRAAADGLVFAVDVETPAGLVSAPLVKGGETRPVTEANKAKYVAMLIRFKLVDGRREQFAAIIRGLDRMMPRRRLLLQSFSPEDLSLVVCGQPDIDLADWRANTIYVNFSVDSPQVQNFWSIVEEATSAERRAILRFVTGLARPPLTGFASLPGASGVQRFQIRRAWTSESHHPVAHTCLNALDVPMYASREQFKQKLFGAIGYASSGFHIS